MEKLKFLIQLKITIGNNTKHIQLKKSNGMMVCVFDWDSIQEEGNIHEVIGNEFEEEE